MGGCEGCGGGEVGREPVLGGGGVESCGGKEGFGTGQS